MATDMERHEDELDLSERRSSWPHIDLAWYLEAGVTAIEATVGHRTDGVALAYPGRVSGVIGEPESLKGWLVLLVIAHVLADGGRALYVDFEDSPTGIAERLLALGVPPDVIRERLSYRRPDGPFGVAERADLESWLADGCDLAVIDGVTEALAWHSLKSASDVDIADFLRLLPRWIAARGPAVLLVDHVIKDAQTRGRWATGSGHKVNGIDGVLYSLRVIDTFGRATAGPRTGRARLTINKDRPGAVEAHSVTTSKDRRWIADLVLTAYPDGTVDAYLDPPTDDRSAPPVPGGAATAELARRIVDALTEAHPEPLTVTAIYDRVEGDRPEKRRALNCLIADGAVLMEKGKRRAQLHRLAPANPEGQENP